MAAFNAEKFILEQLNSIINQSIKPEEIVICDDASKDNTSKLINNFKNKVGISINIIKHKKNLGYHRAFETAIKNCSGDIIFISCRDSANNLEFKFLIIPFSPNGVVFIDSYVTS